MKRRDFLGLVGEAASLPALPSPIMAQASGYIRIAVGCVTPQ